MRAAQLIMGVCALAAAPAGPSIGDFHLPPKAVFSTAMPRYPNVWFYLDASLAADHQAAVKLVTGELRQALHIRELRLLNSEGCDCGLARAKAQGKTLRRPRSIVDGVSWRRCVQEG